MPIFLSQGRVWDGLATGWPAVLIPLAPQGPWASPFPCVKLVGVGEAVPEAAEAA